MRFQGLSLLLGVTALFVRPGAAFARGLPPFFESGQKILRAGPLPEPFDKEEELQGYEAGYACDVKAILGATYARANCRALAFQGDSYIDEPQLVAAIQARYPEAALRRGFGGRGGWLILLAAASGGVAFSVNRRRARQRAARRRAPDHGADR